MLHYTLLIGSRNYSSWSLRAWLALRLTGLPFQERLFDLRGPQRSAIAGASPSGLVPSLIVARPGAPDLQIWDSLAIGEYLAEVQPAAQLWPSNPDVRAVARSAVCEMHSGFAELRRTCPMDLAGHFPQHTLNTETAKQVERIVALWAELRRNHGAGGDYLFGAFGLADCFYAPVVTRFQTYGIALQGAASEYAQAIQEHAMMQEWTNAARHEERARAA